MTKPKDATGPAMYPGGKRKGRIKKVIEFARPTEESKRALISLLLRGENLAPLERYRPGDHECWFVSEDAWNIPFANKGGRELVFQGLLGPIHSKSILVKKCSTVDCVNPGHCSVMDKREAKERESGKWQERIVSPQYTVVKRDDFERCLLDSRVKEQAQQKAREAKSRAKRKAELLQTKEPQGKKDRTGFGFAPVDPLKELENITTLRRIRIPKGRSDVDDL